MDEGLVLMDEGLVLMDGTFASEISLKRLKQLMPIYDVLKHEPLNGRTLTRGLHTK